MEFEMRNSTDSKEGSNAHRYRLIEDFIIPALKNQSFHDLLKWDPHDPSVFMIQWMHKARSCWSQHDASVFLAWDSLRGRHWSITDKNLVDSKQRLRAALRSNKIIKEVPPLDGYKRYKILSFNLKHVKQSRSKHNIKTPNIKSEYLQSSGSESPPKKLQKSGNVCAKCDFESSVREEFKNHILSHKTLCNTFQCQECGLCFVSQVSLTKHLRIVHKICDTLTYIKEEGTNYSPEVENPSGVSKHALECGVCFTSFPNAVLLKAHRKSHKISNTLKYIKENKSYYITEEENLPEKTNMCSLECDVCFTVFSTEHLLKIHKRSHGMAFIKAVRSGL